MSAWTVSSDHIDLLTTAAMRLADWNPQYINVPLTADTLGQDLWKENFDSVNYRYDDHEPVPEYHWTPVAELQEEELRPEVLVEVIAAAHCYSYQSCEHPAWSDSKAYWTSEAILHWAESKLHERSWPKSPRHGEMDWHGRNVAAWGWDRDHGFPTASERTSNG